MKPISQDKSAAPDASAILQKAMERHQQGDLFEADLLYRQALQLAPDSIQTLRLCGILARERGEIDQSLDLLSRAHRLAPTDSNPLNELALSHMAAGNLSEAESFLRQALQLQPESAKIHTNLGALLHHRGHLLEAIERYKQVLDRHPEDLYVRCNLAKAFADAGRVEDALAECDAAASLSNKHPHVLGTRGAVLTDARNYTDARATLEQIAATDTVDDMALVNLALCCYELGDIEAASDALQTAIRLNPFNARAVADLANCLMASADVAGALDLCESFLRQNPGERMVVGAYALALQNAGDAAAADSLTNCEQLVRVYDLPCPSEYTDQSQFNAELAASILADDSLLRNPVSKSTFGGDQTGELEWQSSPALQALRKLFDEAINDAASAFTDLGLSDHPAMLAASEDWTLRGWATVIRPGGKQTSHMHPLAWLSGVYYVSLPNGMNAEEPEAGWLEFGRPPERLFAEENPPTRRYEPAEGRLILFPSWFWHQTVPFTAGRQRISLAFDVMPRTKLHFL